MDLEIPDELVDVVLDVVMSHVPLEKFTGELVSGAITELAKMHIKSILQTKGFILKEEKRIVNEKFVQKILKRF
jgi:hypothetical protein